MSQRRVFVGIVSVMGLTAALSAVASPPRAARRPAADTVSASPTSIPSASPLLDTDFLLLPAYDLELAHSNDAAAIHARVGDSLPLRVSGISLPPGVSAPGLNLAIPAGNSSLDDQGFAIESARSAAGSGSSTQAELSATLVPIRPGRLTIPSLAIVAPGVNGAPARPIARTNPLPMDVASAIAPGDPKPQEPAPVRPPLMIDFPTWVLVVAAGLGLLLLGGIFYGLYRWSRGYRARLPAKPVGPPLSEDEAALLALVELERSNSLSLGEYKKHAFRVSEILKVYIGARYQFDAPECTTQELFARLEALVAADPVQRRSLRALFEKLDQVKFTDHKPALPEASGFVADARQFVQGTRKPAAVRPAP